MREPEHAVRLPALQTDDADGDDCGQFRLPAALILEMSLVTHTDTRIMSNNLQCLIAFLRLILEKTDERAPAPQLVKADPADDEMVVQNVDC